MGFTYASRFPVEEWARRFRARYESDTALVLYEVPVMGGLARLGRPFIERGMRRGTPKALHGQVILVYRGADEWKKRLGVDLPDAAYLVLLDREGRIAWLHRGGFSEEAFEALARQADGLRAADPR